MKMPKHTRLLQDEKLNRWFLNLKAGSYLTATVYLRTLGHYCELNKTNPEQVLVDARAGRLRDSFMDFVRSQEDQGKAGSYIARFKRVLVNWLKFNGIDPKLGMVKIRGINESPTIENERVPSHDELARILRFGTFRSRVSMSLMAYSGLRPETLGNAEGTDCLRIGDLKELVILQDHVEFSKSPSVVYVRKPLSKKRMDYFTFIGDEGITYIQEYLNARIQSGEVLGPESPLVTVVSKPSRTRDMVRTVLISREIRMAIRRSGYEWRPYVLRAYNSTQMDICESKGLVTHNWREFWHGHKGDISARYSTNKQLAPDIVEQMRESYRKCLPYLQAGSKHTTDEIDDRIKGLKRLMLKGARYSDEEIDEGNLLDLDDTEFAKLIERKKGSMAGNGHKQKVVLNSEVKHYIEDLGWEFVKDLNNRESIVKFPQA